MNIAWCPIIVGKHWDIPCIFVVYLWFTEYWKTEIKTKHTLKTTTNCKNYDCTRAIVWLIRILL